MAKVITFSKVFPKGHPKQGQPTHFVEQISASLNLPLMGVNSMNFLCELNLKIPSSVLSDFDRSLISIPLDKRKNHTIRAGNRFKKGDFFSPRVWSGKPYNSKMITIAPDTEIINTWSIEIYPTGEIMINGKFFCSLCSENWYKLCKNDGLSSEDMRNWFSKLPFKGQIICWLDNVSY